MNLEVSTLSGEFADKVTYVAIRLCEGIGHALVQRKLYLSVTIYG